MMMSKYVGTKLSVGRDQMTNISVKDIFLIVLCSQAHTLVGLYSKGFQAFLSHARASGTHSLALHVISMYAEYVQILMNAGIGKDRHVMRRIL